MDYSLKDKSLYYIKFNMTYFTVYSHAIMILMINNVPVLTYLPAATDWRCDLSYCGFVLCMRYICIFCFDDRRVFCSRFVHTHPSHDGRQSYSIAVFYVP